MIDFSNIISEFSTLVGFRSTNSVILPSVLTTSDSGLYVNDLPKVSLELIENFVDVQEALSSGDLIVGNWYLITDTSGGADFTTVGATLNIAGEQFICTSKVVTWGTGILNTLPIVDYLYLLNTTEIQSALNYFTTLLQKTTKVKDAIVNDKLLDEVGTIEKDQSVSAKGYYFCLNSSNTMELKIKSLSALFKEVDTIRFYLYEVGVKAPIKILNYTSKAGEIFFDELDSWILNYQDNTNNAKKYLLLYYEYDSENVQADIQLSTSNKAITDNCYFENNNLNYIYFKPISIPKKYWNWNVDKYDIPNLGSSKPLDFCVSDNNSINLDFNINCNITNVLIDNKYLFSKVLQLIYAIRILNDAFSSPESNKTLREGEGDFIKYADKYTAYLHGDYTRGESGVKFMEGEMQKVVNDFKNIDLQCFREQKKQLLTITNNFSRHGKSI